MTTIGTKGTTKHGRLDDGKRFDGEYRGADEVGSYRPLVGGHLDELYADAFDFLDLKMLFDPKHGRSCN